MSQANSKISGTIGRSHTLSRSHGGPAPAKARTLPPPPPSAAYGRLNVVDLGPALSLAPLEIESTVAAPKPSATSKRFSVQAVGGGIAIGFLLSIGYVFGVQSTQPTAAPHAASQLNIVRPALSNAGMEPHSLVSAVPTAHDAIELGLKDAPLDAYVAASAPAPLTAAGDENIAAHVKRGIAARAPRATAEKHSNKRLLGLGPVAPPADVDLPEQPSRSDIQLALEQVRPALLECTQGAHGVTYAAVTIANTGKVAHSIVEGNFVGTGAGSCIARALRGVSFPAFTGPNFKVRYPFSL